MGGSENGATDNQNKPTETSLSPDSIINLDQ
jgi:hypothetical protein